MRFVDTHRFSPVANKEDLPWDEDYFHLPHESINEKAESQAIIDEAWWYKQYNRCINGYEVEMAVEPGGDHIIDGIDALWYGNDVYLPQYDYWIKNRTVKITGRHYFYLNFWVIYGLAAGAEVKEIVAPRFLDIDFLFALRIEKMIIDKLDCQELKGRQLGFSEKGAGMVIGYNFTFVDGSLNLIVGGIEDDALKTMRDCLRGLKRLKNTQFYKETAIGGNSQTYLQAKHTLSSIHCLTAKDNPEAASRFSPYWVWMEEIGKGKKEWSIKTAGYIRPSIEAEGGKKTGFIHYIGTGGEMNNGVYDLEERHYNPDKYKILKFKNVYEKNQRDNYVGHFTAKDLFDVIDKHGNSYREISRKRLLEERAKLSPKDRYLHSTQYPLYADEVFYVTGGGFFGEHIVQLLNERLVFLNNNKAANLEQRGHLSWKDTKNKKLGVVFTPDPEGDFYIYERPEFGKNGELPISLYFAGTDSYDQDVAHHSDSLGSCRIWKGFLSADKTSRKWVAKILQRPTEEEGGAERFYENTALLCSYYGARNLIEYSKFRIMDYYQKAKLTHLLKERPEALIASWVSDSKQTNRYGIDPSTKKDWLNQLREILTPEVIDNMWDADQVRRFAKFQYDPTGKKYNCDETIASSLSIVHQKDDEDYAAVYPSDSSKEEQKNFHYVEDAYGNIVQSFHSSHYN